jgi:hypothetical protein
MKEDTLAANIQRIADGSHESSERHETLHWIEGSAPCYWRDLALAFVENQILREAATEKTTLTTLPAVKREPSPRLQWAVAACLAIGMFAAGFAVNTSPTTPKSGAIPSLNPPAPPAGNPRSSSTFPALPATITPVSAPNLARSTATLRQLNTAIASSGYEAALMTRYLSQKRDDGSKVVIPVTKVIVRQRGE